MNTGFPASDNLRVTGTGAEQRTGGTLWEGARLQMLLDSTGEGIYAIDTQGNCTFANRSCLELLGYGSVDELLGRNMHDLIHHTDRYGGSLGVDNCIVYQAFTQNAATHSRNELFWRKQGTSFPAEVWSYPIVEGGRVSGAVVVFDDASRKLEFEATQNRLAAIVDQSLDAIIGISPEGIITSWNRGAELIYGFDAAEAVGQPESMLSASSEASERPPFFQPAAGLAPLQFETLRQRRDGTPIEAAVTVSPLRDVSGRISGYSMIERDISERRRTEQVLIEAKEQAEAGNEAKSEFVANISHELRTPMNAIIGMLDLSLRRTEDSLLTDYLETARESAHLLLALVNDLLDFSRMEAGRFELDDHPFSLRQVVGESMRAISLRANEQGLELVYRVDPEIEDSLRGDPRRLRQIILNLVGNGIKFTEAGEVVLWIDVDRREEREEEVLWLRLTVSDTGIGIASSDLNRIFEPFTQVDASSTRQYPGAGLGLTICRDLVAQMDGQIAVDSQLGKGTTVVCTARFKIDRSNAPAQDPLLPTLRGKRALIVDDNATNRRILEETLSQWGITTVSASSAAQALHEIESQTWPPFTCDFALIDVLMPGMDGLSLVRTLRDNQALLGTPVLLLSSTDQQQMQVQSQILGIARCLQKPISQEDLLEALAEVLGAAVQEPAPAPTAAPAPQPRSLNVLVAEDTRANQKVIRSILKSRGHVVDVAGNGREAVESASQNRHDVIIMDVQMPVMDGLEATRMIRRLPDRSRSRTPIIALTAHAMKGDRLKCLDAGMDAYLAKPIDADELIRLVEHGVSIVKSGGIDENLKPAGADMTSSAEEETILDVEGALRRMGQDATLLREIAEMFLEDVPPMIDQIGACLDSGDFNEAMRLAHSIKGLAANLGAQSCSSIAARLEEVAQPEKPDDCRLRLQELRQNLELTNAAIRSRILR